LGLILTNQTEICFSQSYLFRPDDQKQVREASVQPPNNYSCGETFNTKHNIRERGRVTGRLPRQPTMARRTLCGFFCDHIERVRVETTGLASLYCFQLDNLTTFNFWSVLTAELSGTSKRPPALDGCCLNLEYCADTCSWLMAKNPSLRVRAS
jgi:hypothetical protein